MAWSNTHDIAYCFMCVSFMADNSLDIKEIDAIRGNVEILLPDLPEAEFDAAMDEATTRFVKLKGEEARTAAYDECVARLVPMFKSDDERFTFIKNLAYIARADARIHDLEVALVERAVAALGMTEQITLDRQEKTLFVDRKS